MKQRNQQLYDVKYYDRVVSEAGSSNRFRQNQAASRASLEAVIRSFDQKIDVNNDKSLGSALKHRKSEKEKIEEAQKKLNGAAWERAQQKAQRLDNEIKVLEDYNKVKSANLLTIPIPEKGSVAYYAIQDDIGGVTAKVSLCDQRTVETSLTNLAQFNSNLPSADLLQDYLDIRDHCKISTNAMLKLPKHQKVKEVLREEIALSISRILGFHTTESYMVSHQGQPALFIPFEKIKLMKEFSEGMTFGSGKKTYTHYSTKSAVGEGNIPNKFIESFGKTLAFFFLCNDPDAFGGYNQNKALLEETLLFIFDQVLFGKNFLGVDNFIVDSRCNLVPNPDSLLRHSRHTQGRNRTLVDDSPLSEKLDSLFTMIDEKENIVEMLQRRMVETYQEKLAGGDEDHVLQQFLDESKANIAIVERRIDHIFDHFPTYNGGNIGEIYKNIATPEERTIFQDDILHALSLEKLLNHPRLFTKDGRSYTSPSTAPHTLTIQEINSVINEDAEEKSFDIRFSKAPDKALLKQISLLCGDAKTQGLKIGIHQDNHCVIRLSQKDLKKIQETTLFPEAKPFDAKTNYLDINRLKLLMNNYGTGYRHETIRIIEQYHLIKQYYSDTSVSITISLMKETLEDLQKAREKAEKNAWRGFDQGFVKDVLRSFQFEMQQTLQKIVQNDPALKDAVVHLEKNEPISLLDAIKNAFDTAVQLDRVGSFNEALMAEINNKPLGEKMSDDFLTFLKNHQSLPDKIGHSEAVERSASLENACQVLQAEAEQRNRAGFKM